MKTTPDDGYEATRTTRTEHSRPLGVYLYMVGALGLGVSALFGGGSLALDPTGESMAIPVEWLDGTPFADYFVPGVILFGVLGVGSFLVLYGLYARRSWAWHAAVGLGVALVGWIVVQMLMIRMFDVLHLVYGGLGVALVVLALLPSVRTSLKRSHSSR